MKMAVGHYVSTKPKFVLHGIELDGSFGVYFESGKWYKENFVFEGTKISGEDLKKLTEATKSGIEVPIEFGNGKGKAKIRSFHYDPKTQILTSISIDLIDWGWK